MSATIVAKFKQDDRTLALKQAYFDNLNLNFQQETPGSITQSFSLTKPQITSWAPMGTQDM